MKIRFNIAFLSLDDVKNLSDYEIKSIVIYYVQYVCNNMTASKAKLKASQGNYFSVIIHQIIITNTCFYVQYGTIWYMYVHIWPPL